VLKHCRIGRCVVFDIETTGLSASRGSRIVEIGAVAVDKYGTGEEFHSLVDPGVAVSRAAQRVSGITGDMLVGMPKPAAVFPRFSEFIGDALLVAHNADFDVGFLRHEFGRLGLGLLNSWQCTLAMSRKRLPDLRDHKLQTVYRHLFGGLPAEATPHRALDDARMTARVWMELAK
jgi:DNA polymerase-3 subunit epsilon